MKCQTCHRDAPDDALFCSYCGGKLCDGKEPTAFDYAAFISYRHLPRDQEVAKRVQQAIETYRMPRNVAHTARGERLGKCFRDEDELAAAHSLPDRILDALSKSSSLVVICTPATAESSWVEREVAAFIEMHGPERVFTVLADGDSSESIPNYLTTTASLIGTEEAHANPLAVDMRPESSGKAHEETLRLIAAIAECSFDDLKQRDRARRRKRRAAVALAAIAVIAAIAAALAFASAAHEEALTAESRRLATESEQLLAQGDRYGALEKALEALPESESSNDKPTVFEAWRALEDALGIHFDEQHPWNLRYTLAADGEIAEIQASPENGWVAVLDSNLALSFYDIGTGKQLSEVALASLVEEAPDPQALDPREWDLAPAGSQLIAWERNGNGLLCCIEAETGNVAWEHRVVANALAVSDDGEIATALSAADDSISIGAIHLPTGEWWGSRQFGNPGIPRSARRLPASMGNRASTLYAGFDNTVIRYDIAEGTESSARVPDSETVLSVAPAGETTIAASSTLFDADEKSANYKTADFTITALDADMQALWATSGTWNLAVVDSQRGLVGADQDLTANAILSSDEPVVVVQAGNTAKVLSLENGDVLYEEDFGFPIVGTNPIGFGDDDVDLYITCADGNVHLRKATARSFAGGPIAFTYPSPVDNARVDFYRGKGFFAVARSLDDLHRMFVYQAETRTAQDAIPASDYSLDELIEMAHGELAAIAQ